MTAQSEKGFFISTAIAYPNSRMHVGFGWEVIGSDMISRFQRMQGREVFFCTGTDEHSQNVEKAAEKVGLTPKVYCDQMADAIKESMKKMDIAYDRFIRTSDPDHEKVCQYLIKKAFESGDVYKQKYEGLYCESCEVFYTEKETSLIDGAPCCATHKLPLKRVAEENYFFKLSKYEDQLKEHFKRHPEFLLPEYRRNEVVSFLENGLKDFSVSRTSFKWGISLPFDREHIIYVWYDALINYLSAIQFPIDGGQGDSEFFNKFWPADVHVIGKDITRFHSVYWPAMLWSAGIELPRTVWAHGFINLNGEKMSKTRGNIVTPDEVIADFGSTALRWYLLSANSFGGDGNYADQDIVLKCNADLSNNIGNLVNRVVNMSRKYFGEQPPKISTALPSGVLSIEKRMDEHLGKNGEKLAHMIQGYDLSGYCQKVIEFAMSMNKFIDETKPWALAKDPELKPVLENVIASLLEGIRCLGLALWPVIPEASEAITHQLGLGDSVGSKVQKLQSGRQLTVPSWAGLQFDEASQFKLPEPKPLFARLEIKQ